VRARERVNCSGRSFHDGEAERLREAAISGNGDATDRGDAFAALNTLSSSLAVLPYILGITHFHPPIFFNWPYKIGILRFRRTGESPHLGYSMYSSLGYVPHFVLAPSPRGYPVLVPSTNHMARSCDVHTILPVVILEMLSSSSSRALYSGKPHHMTYFPPSYHLALFPPGLASTPPLRRQDIPKKTPLRRA
jgi:hypothetical protein